MDSLGLHPQGAAGGRLEHSRGPSLPAGSLRSGATSEPVGWAQFRFTFFSTLPTLGRSCLGFQERGMEMKSQLKVVRKLVFHRKMQLIL